MSSGTYLGQNFRLTVDGDFRPHAAAVSDESRRRRAFAYLEKNWQRRAGRASLTAFVGWSLGSFVVWGILYALYFGF